MPSIQAPSKSGSLYHNYKGFFSIVLMAIVDAQCCFKIIDVGGYGSQSDGGTFKKSAFGSQLLSGHVNLPDATSIPGSNVSSPYVFVADDAFQLTENIMKPYSGKKLDEAAIIFNYRLSRARRCVENAFGILAARWRIFQKPISVKPDAVDNIIKATVALHNFLKMTDQKENPSVKYVPPTFVDREDYDGSIIRGDWREIVQSDTCFKDEVTVKRGVRNHTLIANEIRAKFKEFFLSDAGSVLWQRKSCGFD